MINIESPIQYLFEVSCCLLIFYLFYHWMLRKETFFQFNRFYLLFTPLISLVIPALQLGELNSVQQQTPQNLEFIPQAIHDFQQTEVIFYEKINSTSMSLGYTWGNLFLGIYVLVVSCFLILFFRKLWTVRKMIQSNRIEKKEKYQLVILPKIKTPFSFFSYLFWNGKTEKETELMLNHEQVHIRQWHSVDIVIMEILIAFFWFHPLVYFFRKAIKMTHEYLADQTVTQEHGNRKKYATLLLASATNKFPPLASTFNSFIKNRLEMIYKKRTPTTKLWKLIPILPLTLMLTLLFSCDQVNSISNDPVGKVVDNVENLSNEILQKKIIPSKDTLKNGYNINEQHFDVQFQMGELKNDKYYLFIDLELKNDAYIISPFSKDTTYGHFNLSFENTKHLTLENQIVESPNSVEEFDPVLESLVKFVRVNTTYRQKLKLTKEEEFEISGLVELLLEPICIPYDIHFTISYKDGKMKVKKTKTVISSEYKL